MIPEALEHKGAVAVLAYIVDHPGCTKTEMQRILAVPGSRVTWDRVKRLVEAGLVEQGDGHVKHNCLFLKATPKGQRIVEFFREVEE